MSVKGRVFTMPTSLYILVVNRLQCMLVSITCLALCMCRSQCVCERDGPCVIMYLKQVHVPMYMIMHSNFVYYGCSTHCLEASGNRHVNAYVYA